MAKLLKFEMAHPASTYGEAFLIEKLPHGGYKSEARETSNVAINS
jgi:hypothetical protein